jgi:hypothetical protein
MNEQLDERNAQTLGQIAREVTQNTKNDESDLMIGKFLEKVYVKLRGEQHDAV